MKTKVQAGDHPWIDGWNKLIADPLAQNTYTAAAQTNMGVNRQRASQDAHAAYLNTIRWYISGDTSYANCAVNICNAWSAAVNQVPTGTDTPGLIGIPIAEFAIVGELLRTYPGWAASDLDRFKGMMTTYLYPVCHAFLTNHNGACSSAYWSNWDIANIGACIAIGVLCDDTTIFNEGVTYYQSGSGMGSIMNAVYYLHTTGSSTLGQWQESGRDQEHAQLAVGMLAQACEVAWKQGVDLYGYSSNRLLAGAEYVAQTNLSHPVPYQYYTNCDNANQSWVSVNGLGRLDDRPLWELLYNHYVIRQGLSAPNTKAMAQLMRPEHGSYDHFGYGTLTFTLSGTDSPYPPLATPAAPSGLTAKDGVGQVELSWDASAENAAQGYNVLRSTASSGPYTSIASWTANTNPQYVDASVANGTTYYYAVAAINQSGTGAASAPASATPRAAGSLPAGWINQDVGNAGAAGSASYASVNNGTFVVAASGTGIGGTSDGGYNYTYVPVTGNFTLTARLWNVNWNSGGGMAGIMMRESLNANSATFLMKLSGRFAAMGIRASTGANLNHYSGNAYTWVPAWFRVQRSGDNFMAYESSDGVNWFLVGGFTYAMANTYYAGLVMSNGSSTLNTATFDHVNFSVPSAPVGVSARQSSGNAAIVSWAASDTASAYTVKRSGASGGPYITIATNVTSTTLVDSNLTVGTPYYYVVSASNVIGESADSAEVGVTLVNTTTVSLSSVGSQDGYVRGADSTNVAGGAASTATPSRLGDGTSDRQYKAFLSFDTSSLPDNAVMVSGTLKFKRSGLTGTNPFTDHGTCYADVKGGTGFSGTSSLTISDFEAGADATQVATMSNPGANGEWSSGGLNAAGLIFIGRTASTQFRVYFSTPADGDGGSDYISWYTGADATADNRPVLEVAYFLEATSASPKAHLKFDEGSGTTATDSSGNGWNGTLLNGPTWGPGKINNGLNLSGSAHVTLPTGVVNTLSDFTISAWVNVTGTGAGARLFDFGAGTATNMYLTVKNGANSRPRFGIKINDGAEQQIDAAAALTTGAWTHLAVTLSGSTAVLYVNGLVSGSNTAMSFTPSAMGSTTQNYIGRSQWAADSYLQGAVDDFRIYNRALNAAEIAALAIPPAITSATTAQGTSGSPFTYQITASNNPVSYGASGLPTGLNVNVGTGLISGTPAVTGTYSATISASNMAGTGSASLTVTVLPPRPEAPAGLMASGTDAAVALSWGTVSGATGYTVWRSTTSGSNYSVLAGGTTTLASYTDNGLSNGTTYYYVVRAVNSGGSSANSGEASAMPLTAMQAWRLSNFGTVENSGNAADTADPDGDGCCNLMERAVGTDPNVPNSGPVCVVGSNLDHTRLTLQFNRIQDASLTYTVEGSGDLVESWSAVWSSTGADNVAGSVTVTDTVDLSSQPKRFLRLRVTR